MVQILPSDVSPAPPSGEAPQSVTTTETGPPVEVADQKEMSLADAFLPGPWFREFHQDYGDGIRVTKRGLDASALVVSKYDISADEVLALSTYDGRNRAMTVFHFHPDFVIDRRRHYMESHREGYDVARDVTQHMDALKAHRRSAIGKRISKAHKAVSMAAHAAAMFLLAHYSSGR